MENHRKPGTTPYDAFCFSGGKSGAFDQKKNRKYFISSDLRFLKVTPAGFKPTTFWSVVRKIGFSAVFRIFQKLSQIIDTQYFVVSIIFHTFAVKCIVICDFCIRFVS